MQKIGTLDEAFAWLASVGGTLTMETNAVECRAPGAWHCVRADVVTLPGIRILVAVNSVHEQVTVNAQRGKNKSAGKGHGTDSGHQWAKRGRKG